MESVSFGMEHADVVFKFAVCARVCAVVMSYGENSAQNM
jgi:hypothetical protein